MSAKIENIMQCNNGFHNHNCLTRKMQYFCAVKEIIEIDARS
jgi:hypothetical protein